MLWTCCICISKFTSWSQLGLHLTGHSSELTMAALEDFDIKDALCPLCCDPVEEVHCMPFKKVKAMYCDLCHEVFVERNVLVAHLKLVHGDLIFKTQTWYRCRICCKKLYCRPHNIDFHMRHVHKQINIPKDDLAVKNIKDVTFSCQICEELCVLSKYCAKHKFVVKPKSILNEPKDLVDSPALRSYQCSEHTTNCHACQSCDESFDNCDDLWTHMFMTHENEDLVCNLCGSVSFKSLTSFPVLVSHMKVVHKIYLNVAQAQDALKRQTKVVCQDGTLKSMCPLCSKVSSNFRNLKEHVIKHFDVRLYFCPTCKRSFKRASELRKHLEFAHTNERSVCTVCGKCVKQLRAHMELHNEEKRYACKLCGAAFQQKEGLNSHMYTHTDKSFTCSVCGMTFRHPNNLRAHVKYVHKEKPMGVTCKFCGKFLNRPESLRNHIATFHKVERPFSCQVCNVSYPTRKMFMRKCKNHISQES